MDTFTAVMVCTCLSMIGPTQTVEIGAREKMTLRASEVHWAEATSNKKLEPPIQLPEITIPYSSGHLPFSSRCHEW